MIIFHNVTKMSLQKHPTTCFVILIKITLFLTFPAIILTITSCGAKTGLKGPQKHTDGNITIDVINESDIFEINDNDIPDGIPDEIPPSPPQVSCPETLYASPQRPAIIEGHAEDSDGWITKILWELIEKPNGSNSSPIPANSPTTSLTPDIAGTADNPATYILKMTATDNMELQSSCQTTVLAITGKPLAICPPNASVVAGSSVELRGDAFDDVMITSYLWEIVSGPPGYRSTIINNTSKVATFIADATDLGTFTIRFTVWDNEGLYDDCEMLVTVGGVPTAICPEDMTIPTRTTVTLEGRAEDDGVIVSWLWECIENTTDTMPVLGSPGSQNTTFWALRIGTYTMRLTVTDDQGLSNSCTFSIQTTETGPKAICPDDIETTPLTRVELIGSGEDDESITQYAWSLLSKPTGSSAEPPSPQYGQISYFTPDIAGEYRISLMVWDPDMESSSCEFRVIAVSGEGLRVEIYWNPPENPLDRSDVDVHLLHQDAPNWFHETYDCFFSNCDSHQGMVLEWDAPVPEDNPRLDIDDVDGFGPENINIYSPVAGHNYTVGIHYYDAEGMGPASVYVKIYCGEISTSPVYEAGPKTLNDHGMGFRYNDFWKVASIYWNGYGCSVTPIDVVVSASDAMSSR